VRGARTPKGRPNERDDGGGRSLDSCGRRVLKKPHSFPFLGAPAIILDGGTSHAEHFAAGTLVPVSHN